jgi:rhodanese-related sulfurtransferase
MKKAKTFSKFSPFLLILLSIIISANSAQAQEAKKILSIVAYDMLNTIPDTFLIDVRTRAEYQYIGHPHKAYLFPYMFFTTKFAKVDEEYAYQLSEKNKAFIEEIGKVFKKTDNLLIISRDGTRSALAAKDLVEAGYKQVYDVEDGFEGPEFPTFQDKDHHKYYRNLAKTNKIYSFLHRRHYGWQSWDLPWTYVIDIKYIYPPDLKAPEK